MLCMKINKATGERIEGPAEATPTDIPHKEVAWVPVVDLPQPAYDAETEILEPTSGAAAGEWVRGWAVRAMTSQEMAAHKNLKVAKTDTGLVRGVEDLVVLAVAAGWAVPPALKSKVNARRALRGEGPI